MWDGIDQDASTINFNYNASFFEMEPGFGLVNVRDGVSYVGSFDISAILDAYNSGEITMEAVARWNMNANNGNFIRLEANPS